MNAAQIHIALTHLPVFGYLLFTPLFFFAVWKKKQDLLTLVCVMLVLLSAAAIVVFNSGEGAEEIVEEIPGINHDAIHEHEESGEWSFWLLSVSGLAAALVLALRVSLFHPKQFRLLLLMAFLLLVTTVSSLYTAHLGGKIRHPEASGTVQPGSDGNAEDDDHD
jgi:hypothetical protein